MAAIRLLLALLGTLVLTSRAEAASAEDWPGLAGQYVFEITRDGKPIGTQAITVTQNGDTVTAVTESKVAVKILGVVIYRMHQVVTETYQGRRFVALHAETKDPQGLRVADIKRNAQDHWTGLSGRQRQSFDCDCMATAMWNIASVAGMGTRIIEGSEGRLRKIAVEDRGSETLDLPEGSVSARHFRVTGEIARDVWFNAAGNLVAAEQLGGDGSMIRQNLLSDPAGSRQNGQEAGQPAAP